MNQRHLPLQMQGRRVVFQPCCNRLTDSLPHLCRGGVCKGYHQKPVYIYRMRLVADHLYDALHKHGGFSGTRSSRYQNIPVMKFYNLLLFRSKHYRHLFLHS